MSTLCPSRQEEIRGGDCLSGAGGRGGSLLLSLESVSIYPSPLLSLGGPPSSVFFMGRAGLCSKVAWGAIEEIE